MVIMLSKIKTNTKPCSTNRNAALHCEGSCDSLHAYYNQKEIKQKEIEHLYYEL